MYIMTVNDGSRSKALHKKIEKKVPQFLDKVHNKTVSKCPNCDKLRTKLEKYEGKIVMMSHGHTVPTMPNIYLDNLGDNIKLAEEGERQRINKIIDKVYDKLCKKEFTPEQLLALAYFNRDLKNQLGVKK